MSAALPENPGELMAFQAKENATYYYKGNMEGADVHFYFNVDTKCFLCETEVQGKTAKMAGNLEFDENSKTAKCEPVWGVQPFGDNDEWVSTVGEEVKTFTLSSDVVDFEGCPLTKQ